MNRRQILTFCIGTALGICSGIFIAVLQTPTISGGYPAVALDLPRLDHPLIIFVETCIATVTIIIVFLLRTKK
jgi:hypothetical protein